MRPGGRLVIEPLSKSHDLAAFRCGNKALDHYLQRQASQDVRRYISRVFVAVDTSVRETVLGYYTLSATSIDLSVLPRDLARRLPKHPLPAALIGRLAVDSEAQGRGIGRMLLADAVKRTMGVGSEMAVFALVVDAANDVTKELYERFGFAALVENRLFLPLAALPSDSDKG